MKARSYAIERDVHLMQWLDMRNYAEAWNASRVARIQSFDCERQRLRSSKCDNTFSAKCKAAVSSAVQRHFAAERAKSNQEAAK
jgi:SOS response regulatory protein OraA/RecX